MGGGSILIVVWLNGGHCVLKLPTSLQTLLSSVLRVGQGDQSL